MTRKAVRLSLAHAFGVIGAIGLHVPQLVMLEQSHEQEQKVELRVQVESAKDQQMTRKSVRCSLVLVFGVVGAVGPLAPKGVILVNKQEKDQKVGWRVQGEFAQDLQVIRNLVI